jgi:RNA-directed DNA polymerase
MAVEQRDAGRWIENGIKMSEENLSTVTSDKEPKQDKEALRARWAWVEHSVWTDSMLRTLEKGLKGGKWFALIDKVYGEKNLQSSFWKVWRNAGSAGIDGQSVKSFEAKEEQQLQQLAQELRTGGYRPVAVKRVWIPKPGSQEKRPLGIPNGGFILHLIQRSLGIGCI